MNKIIEIDGEKFEADIEKAKELGLIKPVRKLVEDIKVGDVFGHKGGPGTVLVFKSVYDEDSWNMAGLDGLRLYSNFSTGVCKDKLINYLNNRNLICLGNINNNIEKLIRSKR
jgi:hypothetical protein